jgi:hypothetical protein
VLLVVDYAETRADLEAMLRAVLSDPGPIRGLLVARALGEWWDRLTEKSAPAVGALLTAAEPILLRSMLSRRSTISPGSTTGPVKSQKTHHHRRDLPACTSTAMRSHSGTSSRGLSAPTNAHKPSRWTVDEYFQLRPVYHLFSTLEF